MQDLSHPAHGAGQEARDELMPAHTGHGGGGGDRRHADSPAHPMTRAWNSPLSSQENAQLQPPAGRWHWGHGTPWDSATGSSLPSPRHQTFSWGPEQHLAPSHQGPICL